MASWLDRVLGIAPEEQPYKIPASPLVMVNPEPSPVAVGASSPKAARATGKAAKKSAAKKKESPLAVTKEKPASPLDMDVAPPVNRLAGTGLDSRMVDNVAAYGRQTGGVGVQSAEQNQRIDQKTAVDLIKTDPVYMKGLMRSAGFITNETQPDALQVNPFSPTTMAKEEIEKDRFYAERLAQLAAGQNTMDLSPLVQFANQMRNPKSTEAIGVAFKPTPLTGTVQKLMEALGEKREGMRQGILDQEKTQKGGQALVNITTGDSLKTDVGMRAPQPTSGGAASSQGRLSDNKILEVLNNKEFRDLRENVNQLRTAKKFLEEGSIIALGNTLGNIARTIGAQTGVLTDKDLDRSVPPTLRKRWDEFMVWLDGDPSRKADPRIIRAMQGLVDLAFQRAKAKGVDLIGLHKGQLASLPTYAGKDLTGAFQPIQSFVDSIDSGKAVKSGGMSPEKKKRLEELRAKKARGEL